MSSDESIRLVLAQDLHFGHTTKVSSRKLYTFSRLSSKCVFKKLPQRIVYNNREMAT